MKVEVAIRLVPQLKREMASNVHQVNESLLFRAYDGARAMGACVEVCMEVTSDLCHDCMAVDSMQREMEHLHDEVERIGFNLTNLEGN